MARGTVKWVNVEKGYGFIEPDEGGEDLFVHYTGIEGTGFRSLTEGELRAWPRQEGRGGPERAQGRVDETLTPYPALPSRPYAPECVEKLFGK